MGAFVSCSGDFSCYGDYSDSEEFGAPVDGQQRLDEDHGKEAATSSSSASTSSGVPQTAPVPAQPLRQFWTNPVPQRTFAQVLPGWQAARVSALAPGPTFPGPTMTMEHILAARSAASYRPAAAATESAKWSPPSGGRSWQPPAHRAGDTPGKMQPEDRPPLTIGTPLGSVTPQHASWVPAGNQRSGEQESDLLEKLPVGGAHSLDAGDELLNGVQLVSLGCYCGPKLTFQKMGRGAETLPFDWIRTNIDGVLHFLRTDFEGFFDFVTRQPVPGSSKMVMYRSPLHSFWHDDPTAESMRERYCRRMKRFWALGASGSKLLFVRVAASTQELQPLPRPVGSGAAAVLDLLAELRSRFKEARLLLILNSQTFSGPALVDQAPNLIIYFLTPEAHMPTNPDFSAPFASAVKCALDWSVGRAVPQARKFATIELLADVTSPDHWGYDGLGGLDAFEARSPGPLPKPPPEAVHAGA